MLRGFLIGAPTSGDIKAAGPRTPYTGNYLSVGFNMGLFAHSFGRMEGDGRWTAKEKTKYGNTVKKPPRLSEISPISDIDFIRMYIPRRGRFGPRIIR